MDIIKQRNNIFKKIVPQKTVVIPLLLLSAFILSMCGAITATHILHTRQLLHTTEVQTKYKEIEVLSTRKQRLENKLLEEKLRHEEQIKQKDKELDAAKQATAERKQRERIAAISRPQVATTALTAHSVSCETYRPIIAQYAWPVDAAMKVMQQESGCNPNAISPTNDHGLFQLNNNPVYDPAQNIAIAYKKYSNARIGSNNWSAWYAVCAPNPMGIMLTPIQKYTGVNCS